jgi:ABC-type antimicrobial peptide transport system permease subunit
VGIYGVVSFNFRQRTHEFGIRMALGATTLKVVEMALSECMKSVAAGIVLGIAVSVVGSRLIISELYRTKPADPLTLIAVSMLLAGVALAAGYIPARRATKVDPMIALRHE